VKSSDLSRWLARPGLLRGARNEYVMLADQLSRYTSGVAITITGGKPVLQLLPPGRGVRKQAAKDGNGLETPTLGLPAAALLSCRVHPSRFARSHDRPKLLDL
jgi:hypothetical protein